MELRQLTTEDAFAQSILGGEAFGLGRRPPPTEAQPPKAGETSLNLQLGIFDGKRLVAASTVLDFHIMWGGQIAHMGGIAGVMCAADQRGRGHAGRLMRQSLIAMRGAGQYVSALDPFAYEFYRRYGWDWVGERRVFTLALANFPGAPEGKHIKFYDGGDGLEVIKPIYARFAEPYRGMMTREDPEFNVWHNVLNHSDNRTSYVYVYHNPDTGAAEGYLVFRYASSGDTADVRDFAANTPAAYRGLLSILHHLGAYAPKARISLPSDTLLPLFFMANDLEAKARPRMMGRVVCVKQALEALRPATELSGNVAVRVSDPHCDWNTGAFSVTIESGHVSVGHSDSEPDVTVDIQTFSQAYWGHPSLALLRSAGRVTVSDEAQFRALSALLPSAVVYLPDDF